MYIFTFNQTSYFEGLLWSFKLVVCMCVTFTKISKIKKLTIIINLNSITMEFSVSVAFFLIASVRVCKLSFMWFDNYIGWSIKKYSIKVNKKCSKKWRWHSRELKIWYTCNNIMVFLFNKKIFFSFSFLRLIWPIKCLILTLLTSNKYLQNLLKDGTLSVVSAVKRIFILG